MAKHTYLGLQPDELNLDPGDVVNVTRKMADGNSFLWMRQTRFLFTRRF